MKAVLIKAPGDPDVLYIGETEKQLLREGEVLIKMAATAVNRADIEQRKGKYPAPPNESEVLGLEVSGTIVEIAAGVSGWSLGDKVMAILAGGGYGEYVTAPASVLLKTPEGLSLEEAAALPEALSTNIINLYLEAGLKKGERVLIHGGGSGIGTAAIQLVKAYTGNEVFVTVGSEEKAEKCRALGADHVINYKTEDFASRIAEITGKKGVNVILDHIGGSYLDGNMKSLSVGGRLVIIGLMGGIKAELNIGRMMVKRQRIIGSVLRSRPLPEKVKIAAFFSEHVSPLIDAKKIAPVIDTMLPISNVAEAHRLMESSAHFGKIVLTADY